MSKRYIQICRTDGVVERLRRQKDMVGRTVIAWRDIRSQVHHIAEGARLTVDSVWRGRMTLESKTCEHCKVSVYIRDVERSAVLFEPKADDEQ